MDGKNGYHEALVNMRKLFYGDKIWQLWKLKVVCILHVPVNKQ